jgi:hypothetical protein
MRLVELPVEDQKAHRNHQQLESESVAEPGWQQVLAELALALPVAQLEQHWPEWMDLLA